MEKYSYSAMLNAVYNDHCKIVKILLKDERIPISTMKGQAPLLTIAAMKGHNNTIKVMLKSKRILISEDHNLALRTAIQYRKYDTAFLLLESKRIKLSYERKRWVLLNLPSKYIPRAEAIFYQ